MFNSLNGRISDLEFPFVHLTTGGVEWELEVSANSFRSVATAIGSIRRFLVHVYVREDVLKLYGFLEKTEREVFRNLLKVNGIGPRQAIRILSGTSVDALVRSLESDDIDALTTIPGLGRKTAQKILLQLKGHLVPDRIDANQRTASPGTQDDLVEALVQMGFDRAAATTTLDQLREGNEEGTPEEELFRRAIVHLSSPR